MKKAYKTSSVIYVDFHYAEQLTAALSGGAELFGDPQQSGDTSCTYFRTAGTDVCESDPFAHR